MGLIPVLCAEEFVKREELEEKKLVSLVEELFPPTDYRALMRFLIKKHYQRIGGSPSLCSHLKLNQNQIAAFERVRQFGENLMPDIDYSKLIGLLIAAEASLDKTQTQEYWIATGRMPSNISLEEYFASLPENQKQELRKHHLVFRQLSVDAAR